MAKIEKFSGIFQNVGDIVQIQVPPDGEAVLRLYQLTKEIALFYIVADPAAVPPVIPVTRFFQASDANGDLPASFVKYIGAIGLPNPATKQFEEVYVVEVSGPVQHPGVPEAPTT
jgi:hypothetical protein